MARGQRLVIRWLLVQFPWFACCVLGQDAEPQNAPDVLVCTLHGSHHHHHVYTFMNYCKLLWSSVAVSAKRQFKGDISVINCLNILHCSLFQIHYVPMVRTNKKALNIYHLVCIDYW